MNTYTVCISPAGQVELHQWWYNHQEWGGTGTLTHPGKAIPADRVELGTVQAETDEAASVLANAKWPTEILAAKKARLNMYFMFSQENEHAKEGGESIGVAEAVDYDTAIGIFAKILRIDKAVLLAHMSGGTDDIDNYSYVIVEVDARIGIALERKGSRGLQGYNELPFGNAVTA